MYPNQANVLTFQIVDFENCVECTPILDVVYG